MLFFAVLTVADDDDDDDENDDNDDTSNDKNDDDAISYSLPVGQPPRLGRACILTRNNKPLRAMDFYLI